MTKNKTPWHGCPIRYGMGIWGDKWSLLIIRDLMFKGRRYFSEFTDENEFMATNILSDRLKKLENSGVIHKEQDREKKSKYVYSLTAKGKDMLPIMLEIVQWSEKYDKKTEVPKDFIDGLIKNRKRFEAKIKNQLDKLYP